MKIPDLTPVMATLIVNLMVLESPWKQASVHAYEGLSSDSY